MYSSIYPYHGPHLLLHKNFASSGYQFPYDGNMHEVRPTVARSAGDKQNLDSVSKKASILLSFLKVRFTKM